MVLEFGRPDCGSNGLRYAKYIGALRLRGVIKLNGRNTLALKFMRGARVPKSLVRPVIPIVKYLGRTLDAESRVALPLS